ncbi:hypothetical protein LTR84_011786 [Exophiala bonariae]|uniref:Amidase domain-containing protein n=1 Tax=Exophiala bonariae TaxID=1690606 RepID=A0AAV9NIJ7_9EURO|nr:hypothetical protein LTR84_011786 [Exophiala bonariae]
MEWETKGSRRRQQLAAQIPDEWKLPVPFQSDSLVNVKGIPAESGILGPLDIEITESSADEILANVRKSQWSCERVMLAFCKRATIAHQLVNCVTNFLIEEALETAREHDKYLADTGQVRGPLHGLPISVKDCLDVAGHETTSGLVSRIGFVAKEDALVIRCLRQAGAIPFVKTNLAQATLLVESTNNVFGLVTNPSNRQLTAGGSSGGEGALIALFGSPLGVCTDGGGSVRLPASWNGVYGFKPSATRIPSLGSRGVGYSDSNLGCTGVIANHIETLSLFMSSALSACPWNNDADCVPIPWNSRIGISRKLRLGLLFDDGITHLTPPVLRVLKESQEKLAAAGHDVIVLDWSDLHLRGARIIFTMYTQEGGVGVREALDISGEPPVPRLATGWSERPLTPIEIWKNHRARKQLRLDYLRRWKQLDLDAIITAPSPHPAPPHEQYITTALSAIYNLLDYPCCIVPAGEVNLEKDVADEAWYARAPYDKIPNFPYDFGDEELKSLYKGPEVFANSPLALQIVGLPWQEELCLLISQRIDDIIHHR